MIRYQKGRLSGFGLLAVFALAAPVCAEDGKVDSLLDKTQEKWDETVHPVSDDRESYQDYAGKRIETLEDRLNAIKEAQNEEADAGLKSETAPDVLAAENQLRNAQDRLEDLKNADGANWQETQPAVKDSLDSLASNIENLGADLLPERTAAEWRAEDAIADLKYKEASLQAASENAAGEAKGALQVGAETLKEKVQSAEGQLKDLQKATDAEWQAKQRAVDQTIDEARAAYRRAASYGS